MKEIKPVATLSESAFSGVELGDFNYDEVDARVYVRDFYNNTHTPWRLVKLRYNVAGDPYIIHRGRRYHTSEFMRNDYGERR